MLAFSRGGWPGSGRGGQERLSVPDAMDSGAKELMDRPARGPAFLLGSQGPCCGP